jgi:hypothetical protein
VQSTNCATALTDDLSLVRLLLASVVLRWQLTRFIAKFCAVLLNSHDDEFDGVLRSRGYLIV